MEDKTIDRDPGKTSFDYMYRLMTMPRYLDSKNIPCPNSAEDNKKNSGTSNE